MDTARCTANRESHGHVALAAETAIGPLTPSLVAQLSSVNPAVLAMTRRQDDSALIPMAAATSIELTPRRVDVAGIAGGAEPPGGEEVMTPHNRLMALFTLEGDARPSRDFDINQGGQPGRDKGEFTPRARLADLFEYYADPLHRQRLFTHLLGVALDIYLLDAFLTPMNHETFTNNSLDSLLSLDALAKVDGGAWHGLPPAEKSAVDMLWRQCIKDELPIVYYAATLGFGDVPVGHEEFATLFAGSLYVYQQKNADLPPTHQALSQTGEALLNVLVNKTLELQLLGYLGLPALFFAAKHTKPAPLNAQQAANIDYKLEAVVLFKAFWRTRAAELYSTSALLRRYAQSVVDCLPRTVPTPARVPRQAPRNARAMRQWEQEGNAVARPGGNGAPHSLTLGHASTNKGRLTSLMRALTIIK